MIKNIIFNKIDKKSIPKCIFFPLLLIYPITNWDTLI